MMGDDFYDWATICPECVVRKHRNCDGTAWANDAVTNCTCSCRIPTDPALDTICEGCE